MSFMPINTSAMNINESNDKIMHNNILVPLMPSSRSDIRNNVFSNFDSYEVLTPRSYKSVNNCNKNEELLIDLSDDDSKNKSEKNAQYGSGVRDFCGAMNQDYDLIDLYENILATPQAILKNDIPKSNSTTKTNFRYTSNNTENETIENTLKDTIPCSLDDLLNMNTEIKANNCNCNRSDQSARGDTIVQNSSETPIFTDFKTNPSSHSTLTSAASKPGQMLIITGDFNQVKSNHGQEQNSSPNSEFHNYAEQVDTSHEDIDDIIDEILSLKSREAQFLQENNHNLQAATSSQNCTNQKIYAAYANRGSNKVSSSGSSKSCIDNENDLRDLDFLPKLKFCDDPETETSSVDIDDLINDIFNLKSLGISTINIEYPKLKATAGIDDLPCASNCDKSSNGASSLLANAEFYEKNVFDPQSSSYESKYIKASRKIKTPEDPSKEVNTKKPSPKHNVKMKGASIYEKSIVLPQMLARIAESNRMKTENSNLKKKLLLDAGNVDYNQVQMLQTKSKDKGKNRKKRHISEKDGFASSPLPEWMEMTKKVNVSPVILMEDSRKVRLEALEKRKLFSEFVKGK